MAIIMAKASTSFRLSEDLAAFVDEQVREGATDSASGLIRTLLERHRDDVQKEKWLHEALDRGLASGTAGTINQVMDRLRGRHAWLR